MDKGQSNDLQKVDDISSESKGTITVPAGNVSSSTHDGIPMWQQEKLGGRCCCCCCDHRTGVMIMALMSFVTSVTYFPLGYDSGLDYVSILAGMTIGPSICGFLGALDYSLWFIGIDLLRLIGKWDAFPAPSPPPPEQRHAESI